MAVRHLCSVPTPRPSPPAAPEGHRATRDRPRHLLGQGLPGRSAVPDELDDLLARARRTLSHRLDRAADDIGHPRARAQALSPLATLQRGYAVLQDADLASRVDEAALRRVLGEVPDAWLEPVPGAEDPEALRERYVAFLLARVSGERPWLPGLPQDAA